MLNIKNSYFLSIYFGFHDSCITISSNKEILLHLEAERVFGKKHMPVNDFATMIVLIEYGLKYLNLSIENIDRLYLARWNNKFEKENVKILGKKFKPIMTGHHENHIGTLFPSGFKSALIVCADGGSEDGSSKIYLKKEGKIEMLEDLDETLMTGKFYGTLTQMIIWPTVGRAHNTYPGKTMGLAALGQDDKELLNLIRKNWKEINKLHFNGCNHLLDIFGLSKNYKNFWEDERRRNLAYMGQKCWVDSFYKKILGYSHLSKNVALVGGCALNVVLNTKLWASNIFDNVYISPVSGDSGQSLGAILFHNPEIKCDYPYLGRGCGELSQVPKQLIQDLLDHKIIAWYQGRSEIGARALGHRSFIGLADSVEMRDKLSQKVKKREPYRPVAPIVASRFVKDFFDFNSNDSPFMTFNPKVKRITKKLVPAIVHFDGTSRVQTMSADDNPVLHKVLLEIGKITGAPILMNSSFNVMNEPIVDTPDDAFRNFFNSEADILYINGKRYGKSEGSFTGWQAIGFKRDRGDN